MKYTPAWSELLTGTYIMVGAERMRRFLGMRRKDRQVSDAAMQREIILACSCCRLGFCDEGGAYIVPLNFGYEERGGKRTFYFHGAREGRKMGLIKAGGPVGFELDTGWRLNEAKEACEYSASFRSVIGRGEVSLIEDRAGKLYGLERIMEHNSGRDGWEYPEEMLDSVAVFKLEVTELDCKEHE